MRLDKFLVEKQFVESRNRASILLEKGLVNVNGKPQKASYDVKDTDKIEVLENLKFVSMGGYKLEKAIKDFNLSLEGKICADIGCSKGGFTQCLLMSNVKKIYAVDVTISELDKTILSDNRVIPIEINARTLDENTFGKVDFVCVDCSFISIKNIIDNLISILDDNGEMVVLLKPQFECGEKNLTKNGIVKNSKILKNLCQEFNLLFNQKGLSVKDFTIAPKRDNKNLEFLFNLTKQKLPIIKDINRLLDGLI